jgi:hypothetical protein
MPKEQNSYTPASVGVFIFSHYQERYRLIDFFQMTFYNGQNFGKGIKKKLQLFS